MSLPAIVGSHLQHLKEFKKKTTFVLFIAVQFGDRKRFDSYIINSN